MTLENGKHLKFPFHITKDGTTAQVASEEEHVKDELIQLILTDLSERTFLPEFGGGARRLVFENTDETTKELAKATMTQAISNWLGNRITLESLSLRAEDEKFQIEIKYRIAGTNDSRIMKFQHGGV